MIELNEPSRFAVPAAIGHIEAAVPMVTTVGTRASQDVREQTYRPFLVSKLSRQFGLRSMIEHPVFAPVCRQTGWCDTVGIMARDGRVTVVASFPLAGDEPHDSDRDPHLYRIRRHLQAGFLRVHRHAVGSDDVIADDLGRVLCPGTRGIEPEMQGLLAAAARAYDRERRGSLPDSDAERIWGELWRGGWALVETVDKDGKRLLLLRRDPSSPRATALDAREQRALQHLARGASYKSIAFDLGVGISTASAIVSDALRKLGLRSRLDFVRRLGRPSA
jgi:DNA-binding CsgD family transcriptional regulator